MSLDYLFHYSPKDSNRGWISWNFETRSLFFVPLLREHKKENQHGVDVHRFLSEEHYTALETD